MRTLSPISLVPILLVLQCGGRAATESKPEGAGGDGIAEPDNHVATGGAASPALGETRSIEVTITNNGDQNIYLELWGGYDCSELSFWKNYDLRDEYYEDESSVSVGYSDTLSTEFGVITCGDTDNCERVVLESRASGFVEPDFGVGGPPLFLRVEPAGNLTYFLEGVDPIDVQTLLTSEQHLNILVGGFLEGDPAVNCMARGDCSCVDDICSIAEEHPSCWYENNCDSEYDWLYEDHQCGPVLSLEIDQIDWDADPIQIRVRV